MKVRKLFTFLLFVTLTICSVSPNASAGIFGKIVLHPESISTAFGRAVSVVHYAAKAAHGVTFVLNEAAAKVDEATKALEDSLASH